jgi:NAD(P)H-hydrate epimerase
MTRQQVRDFDAYAINVLGVPGVVLMENAGRGCAEFLRAELAGRRNPQVLVACGTGNNGGDGCVIARHLANGGIDASACLVGRAGKVAGDARINLDILEKLGLSVERLDPDSSDTADRFRSLAAGRDVIVDALFGTGLSRPVRGGYARVIETINSLPARVLAVDIPSGLDCDTGRPLGAAVKATWTVTFAAVKKGFTSAGAAGYTGRVVVASIGAEPPAVS